MQESGSDKNSWYNKAVNPRVWAKHEIESSIRALWIQHKKILSRLDSIFACGFDPQIADLSVEQKDILCVDNKRAWDKQFKVLRNFEVKYRELLLGEVDEKAPVFALFIEAIKQKLWGIWWILEFFVLKVVKTPADLPLEQRPQTTPNSPNASN
jgi:hypothetical protein